ncbi:MAG: SDR family NAD(P)-dependent oxidoreductase, partial [Fulvivirga sp.]|nr:SDR family NAD(P)-dependent oxidoreductase [Fulvivirga sp.]
MILVTGATGFLGSFICRKLLQLQKPFIGLKRKDSDITQVRDIYDQVTWHECDINEVDHLDSLIAKVDAIIHAAALVSFNRADHKKMDEVNITGTRNIVNLALKHDIKTFIHISSVGALSRNTPKGTIDESSKWQKSKWNSYYGNTILIFA